MIITLAHGYSSESTQREVSNDTNMTMVFKNLYVLIVLWTKVALALEGLMSSIVAVEIHTSMGACYL